MPASNPRSPKLLKGAFIEFSKRFIGSVPNIIVFQYNPETMTRKLEPWYSGGNENSQGGREPINAQPHDPPETFDLALEFDAADELENPVTKAVAILSGVSRRTAALEMLLYPEPDSLGAGLATAVGATLQPNGSSVTGTTSRAIPRGKVPDLLFCWGPGRIVPVRLTSFSIEEQAYSPQLSPLRAKVTVGLKILQPRNLPCTNEQSSEIIKTSYKYYVNIKRGLAGANTVSQSAAAVESILGMLPI